MTILNTSKRDTLTSCISKQFERYLRENDLYNRGTDYHTVAVIGAQSSGKSKKRNVLKEYRYIDELIV